MPQLQEIVVKEAVQLPERNRIVKADYISAIILSRYPDDSEMILSDDEEELPAPRGQQQQESNEETTRAVEETVDESETNAQATIIRKKLLAVNTVKELKAIAAVEAIAINHCKTKAHYIDAIYLARSLKC